MVTHIQSVEIDGKRFVMIPEETYERIRRDRHRAVPPLPPADDQGHRDAEPFIIATIARDVINQRAALDLTQKQLADLAGVRQETVSRLESGKHSPTARTLEKIERALDKAAQRRG